MQRTRKKCITGNARVDDFSIVGMFVESIWPMKIIERNCVK